MVIVYDSYAVLMGFGACGVNFCPNGTANSREPERVKLFLIQVSASVCNAALKQFQG